MAAKESTIAATSEGVRICERVSGSSSDGTRSSSGGLSGGATARSGTRHVSTLEMVLKRLFATMLLVERRERPWEDGRSVRAGVHRDSVLLPGLDSEGAADAALSFDLKLNRVPLDCSSSPASL